MVYYKKTTRSSLLLASRASSLRIIKCLVKQNTPLASAGYFVIMCQLLLSRVEDYYAIVALFVKIFHEFFNIGYCD